MKKRELLTQYSMRVSEQSLPAFCGIMKIAWITTSCMYEGVSREIYISGCKHNCKGCQNPELQDFNFGNEIPIKEIISRLSFRFCDNIVLTGGDPLWSKEQTLELIKAIRNKIPQLKIWLYTGFTRDEIKEDYIMEECFNLCDVVVTDRYIEALRYSDKELRGDGIPRKLVGSSNQMIWRNNGMRM